MRILDAAATRAALPFDRLIAALAAAFARGCAVPPRHRHEIGSLTSLVMPAWDERHYGVKIINLAADNAAHGLPGVHATYVLHDVSTGVPLAIVDGSELTARRTAAASALAASFLARRDATRLVVVGAGRIARLLPEAYRAVRPIESVLVWARRPAEAESLADALRGDGVDAAAVDDLEAACARADVVGCATPAGEPLVRGRWLASGSHLDLIGGYTPSMREADDDCFAGAAIHVDTAEALQKSGDLLGPMARGVFAAADVRGDLAALVRGTSPGRRDAAERTVFKSVGSALEDLAAAVLACDTTVTTGRRADVGAR